MNKVNAHAGKEQRDRQKGHLWLIIQVHAQTGKGQATRDVRKVLRDHLKKSSRTACKKASLNARLSEWSLIVKKVHALPGQGASDVRWSDGPSVVIRQSSRTNWKRADNAGRLEWTLMINR